MHKLAIAATLTAVATGGTIAAVAVTRTTDAHASSPHAGNPAQPATAAAPAKHHVAGCWHGATHEPPPALPALLRPHRTHHAAPAASDCAAVGNHLAELETITGTGNDPARCATDYAGVCASEGWSLERRACTLAADDLMNAHLCAFAGAGSGSDEAIPASLACSVIAPHHHADRPVRRFLHRRPRLRAAGRGRLRCRRVVARAAPVLRRGAGCRRTARVHRAGALAWPRDCTYAVRGEHCPCTDPRRERAVQRRRDVLAGPPRDRRADRAREHPVRPDRRHRLHRPRPPALDPRYRSARAARGCRAHPQDPRARRLPDGKAGSALALQGVQPERDHRHPVPGDRRGPARQRDAAALRAARSVRLPRARRAARGSPGHESPRSRRGRHASLARRARPDRRQLARLGVPLAPRPPRSAPRAQPAHIAHSRDLHVPNRVIRELFDQIYGDCG